MQITRAFAGDLSIRADREGRTVTGIVVPFDVEARVSDGGQPYRERFRRGAFARTIQHRGDKVKLLMQHDHAEPIGRATLLREDAAGLYGEFAVSAVPSGDQALELVRDGVIDSFSVGFSPVRAERDGDVTVRTEVALREASLVTFPAYDDARVLALRAAINDMSDEQRDELLRMVGVAADLPETPATTADERSEPNATDPAETTRRRTHIEWQAFRLAVRERHIV